MQKFSYLNKVEIAKRTCGAKMNLEKMNMLSQKIEGILGTVRTLKDENAKIKRELSTAKAELQDKTLLLDTAKANLVDCKAALDARANQANAQQETLNQQQAEIAALNDKTTMLGQQLIEKDGCIESLNSKVQELNSNIDMLNGQLNEKVELLSSLNEQVSEKIATVETLMQQLSDKNAEIESLNVQLQAQNDEIAEAQEKFNQLVATIESELGSDFALDQGETAKEIQEESVEEPTEEVQEDAEPIDAFEAQEESTAATEEAEETVETEETVEPEEDTSVSQETAEEDIPTIEVHGADEKDNDLFASKSEGSQTNFFG